MLRAVAQTVRMGAGRPGAPTARWMSAAAEEYDLVVVGGGPGGYVAAIKAAQLGMKVRDDLRAPRLSSSGRE